MWLHHKSLRLYLFVLSVFFVLSVSVTHSYAQPELQNLYNQAHEAMSQRDYQRAISIYYQAIKLTPNDIVLRRDLAYAHLLNGEADKGASLISEIIESGRADEETYQLGSAIARAQKNIRKSLQLINSGLKQYPKSGLLHHAKGQHYIFVNPKKQKVAIPFFLEGIQTQPHFANNYLSLAKILMEQKQYTWVIIYAETFILLDKNSPRSVEARRLMYDAYKAAATHVNTDAIPKLGKASTNEHKMEFATAYSDVMTNNMAAMADGFHVENLIIYRARTIIEWQNRYGIGTHSLIDYWIRMMEDGHFDAYNQLILGPIDDSQSYAQWAQNNASAIQKMNQWWNNNEYLPRSTDPQYQN